MFRAEHRDPGDAPRGFRAHNLRHLPRFAAYPGSPSTPLPFGPMVRAVTDVPRDPDPSRILDQLDALQRDLAHAQAEVDRTERLAVLGTLASMIAHEMRGIASKVTGAAQLIERDCKNPARVQELAERIVRMGLHAGRVAETILAAAEEPLPGDCPVLEVHRRALDALPSEARARFDDAGVDPRLHANIDPDALERVLVNLYLNAWRAVGGSSGEGHVRVSADVARSSVFEGEDGGCSARNIVRIRVSDDGPGVHPEMGETLFEPWQRGTGGSGHGLGLALCRHLVGSVGGDIRFAELGGRGAEVVIELPLSDQPVRHVA